MMSKSFRLTANVSDLHDGPLILPNPDLGNRDDLFTDLWAKAQVKPRCMNFIG